uniref:Putative ribonuclease H-like domain-containing protein n=1 Tax=Tanacetum cinerariifolium TaxID=118510 RepID=A0A6L2M3P5_TANCI|nr:putative ribonuclease H-like domain-containing protein [Tanacetum cinerariifolium]
MWEFKECSSCGDLYTKSCACSKGGFIDKFVYKTPYSSQRPPQDCPKCGNPVDGLYCRHCALLRKILKEVWFIICDERNFFQDTFESSTDDSNVVSMPHEPVVFNQDPSKNHAQSPSQIDHHCCYGCGDSLDGIFCQRCTCKSCGNGAHHGYNCSPKVLIISNPEPCHDQNVEKFPQTLPSFHPTCYSRDENSFAYDSTPNIVKDYPNVFNPPSQPPMYFYEFCGDDVYYSYDCPPQVSFIYDPEPCYNQEFNFPQTFKVFNNNILVVRIVEARMKLFNKNSLCYDDDDNEESSIPLRDIIISELPSCIAITSVVSTKDSLIMGDEHLDTIPEKESDEFIKSSVENLVLNLSESKDERECDVPTRDDFTTFSNLLFDTNDDFSSGDNESFSDEDIPKEIYSNPLFDEEIISIKIDPHHLNAESDLIESLLNQDSSIISSSKIDSLLDEFTGELILLKSIPPEIDEADCDPEEEIHLIEKLLYDNSFSRPPKEFIFENSDAAIESFSPSPIPVEDSNSLRDEIDLSLTPDDSMPPGIENDDYNSEGDILILEELLSNDSFSLPKNESFHFDILSSHRPSTKPPDDDDIEPNSEILTVKVEVYVCQPPRFEDPDQPDKVYRVVKALYGLHQAPRAWYETLANYLLGNGFHRGNIDQTLFIKRKKGDILPVHVYVDDIIFGSTKKELCTEFVRLMKDKFQMSYMRELTFVLGLQVKQKEDEYLSARINMLLRFLPLPFLGPLHSLAKCHILWQL